ncbi:hypothetical protein [Microcoleus sp. AT9b-C5]|uniref:hypothetical protein n=1 Tax=unclassified Microcoleus TaxID=2642155 RepID=UPI002FD6D401
MSQQPMFWRLSAGLDCGVRSAAKTNENKRKLTKANFCGYRGDRVWLDRPQHIVHI